MIELTEQQRQELNAGLPRVIDPQTKKTYILISEEAYEHVQALLAPERLPRTEQQALLLAAGLRAGWDDPEMEIYDREEKDRKNPCTCSAAALHGNKREFPETACRNGRHPM